MKRNVSHFALSFERPWNELFCLSDALSRLIFYSQVFWDDTVLVWNRQYNWVHRVTFIEWQKLFHRLKCSFMPCTSGEIWLLITLCGKQEYLAQIWPRDVRQGVIRYLVKCTFCHRQNVAFDIRFDVLIWKSRWKNVKSLVNHLWVAWKPYLMKFLKTPFIPHQGIT